GRGAGHEPDRVRHVRRHRRVAEREQHGERDQRPASDDRVDRARRHPGGGDRHRLEDAQTCPSTTPGTPVLVEYAGWIRVSGRMWRTACATAIAASPNPVAISLSLPSNVVTSPAAHTASIEVFITRSTLIEPFSISSGHDA